MSQGLFLRLKTLFAGILVIGFLFHVTTADAANRVEKKTSSTKSSKEMAEEINSLVREELSKSGKELSEITSDMNFLRRIKFDLTGKLPTANEVTLFVINPDPDKREKLVSDLLASEEYGDNWSNYWWDVIYSKATELRAGLMKNTFERWMAEQLNSNKPWDEISTDMITATGDVKDNGATALIFAQGGKSSEVASEVARVFLGIQIQCANCHDHLTDKWKREQFHELAAFFPRMGVRPVRNNGPRSFEVFVKNSRANNPFERIDELKKNADTFVKRLDKDNNQKLTKGELKNAPQKKLFNTLLKFADKNGDKGLSVEELKNIPPPQNPERFFSEHFMPNLDDPSEVGQKMNPVFFLTGQKVSLNLEDEQRRGKVAQFITDKNNEWFSKALINRLWYELVGEGFYTPVDDIGPERDAIFPEVIEALSQGFIESDYDVKWLMESIVFTDVYQQKLAMDDEAEFSFASAKTGRYRADQLYDSINQVLGIEETRKGGGNKGYRARTPRGKFKELFGFDPSLTQNDIKGSVPQALFMMNSPTMNNLLSAEGKTRLAGKLEEFEDDEDLISELYLMVLSREPSEKELDINLEYMKETGDRNEAAEDILWSLLNSSEFLAKK